MLRNCPRSCDICVTCEDKNETQCEIWNKFNECDNNPFAMMRDCPKTCGICHSSCVDKEKSCPQWVLSGECHKNPVVEKVCAASCGVCTDILHSSILKDEL